MRKSRKFRQGCDYVQLTKKPTFFSRQHTSILQRGSKRFISKATILLRFQGGPTLSRGGGLTFPGAGSNCLFTYKNPYNL